MQKGLAHTAVCRLNLKKIRRKATNHLQLNISNIRIYVVKPDQRSTTFTVREELIHFLTPDNQNAAIKRKLEFTEEQGQQVTELSEISSLETNKRARVEEKEK